MKRIIIISLLFFALCSCNKDKELLEEIYDEPGYAIGKLTSKTTVASVLNYHYEYKVGNNTYKGKKKGGVSIFNDGHRVGLQFLVVYKISEPEKSDLNFRYLIKDEQDFLDLLEKFKTNPPKP